METQLFTWKSWDSYDEGAYTFYRCTLKVDIGEFKVGQELEDIILDFQRGFIQIGVKAYKLNISVAEEISTDSLEN